MAKPKKPTETTPATPPSVSAPATEAPAAAPAPEAEKPKAKEVKFTVDQTVLQGIFNDDPKGKYFSKDGETFLNEEQFEQLKDKIGYQKFEK